MLPKFRIGSAAVNNDEFWTSVYSGKGGSRSPARISLVRIVLLFGVAVAAMALVVLPLVSPDSHNRSVLAGSPGIDHRTTGSIDRSQQSTDAICIIDIHGNRSGGC